MSIRSSTAGWITLLLLLLPMLAMADAAAQSQGADLAPADWSHAADINEANRNFLLWQKEMLKERQALPPELRAVLRKKSYVPPLGPSEPPPEPARLKLDFPIVPGEVGAGLPRVNMSVGAPTISVGLVGQAKGGSFVAASYKAGISYATGNNEWAVGDSATLKLGAMGENKELVGAYQFHASTWKSSKEAENAEAQLYSPTPPKKNPAGAEFTAKIWKVNGTIGYTNDGELSGAIGYDFLKTPDAFKKFGELSLGVEGQASAPLTFKLVRPEDRFGTPHVDNGMASRAASLMSAPVTCTYCSARGELDCPTCSNARKITCPRCKGALKLTCSRCEGGGDLYCTRCDHTGRVSCSNCGGGGRLRCSTCSGSGSVTVYDSETRSREVPVMESAGFDESGQPSYRISHRTEYYTVQVPRSQSCSSCGGNGDGGECGTCGGDGKVTCGNCGGSGIVTCGRCGGSGKVTCDECDGSGKITCPTCNGNTIRCPLCRGKKTFGGK